METLADGGRVDDVSLTNAALEVLGRYLHTDLRFVVIGLTIRSGSGHGFGSFFRDR